MTFYFPHLLKYKKGNNIYQQHKCVQHIKMKEKRKIVQIVPRCLCVWVKNKMRKEGRH